MLYHIMGAGHNPADGVSKDTFRSAFDVYITVTWYFLTFFNNLNCFFFKAIEDRELVDKDGYINPDLFYLALSFWYNTDHLGLWKSEVIKHSMGSTLFLFIFIASNNNS